MAMMRKGQVRKIDGHDIRGQAAFIAGLLAEKGCVVRARPTTQAHP
jgi:hypothetical protein